MDDNKEQITIHTNHIVPYYPKEKHIKLELQNYFLTNEIPTLKKLNITTGTTGTKPNLKQPDKEQKHQYNLRKRKITLFK